MLAQAIGIPILSSEANTRTSWNVAAACVALGLCGTVMYAAAANQSQALYASPTVVGQTSTGLA